MKYAVFGRLVGHFGADTITLLKDLLKSGRVSSENKIHEI